MSQLIKEFIDTVESFVYKEVAKNTNLILGKNKTAALSTGIFLKLPIEISVSQTTAAIPKLYKELETFMPYFSAYTMIGNITKVYFTFMYHEEKDLKAILNHLHRYSQFFALVYLHEVQHILRKHVTHSYNTMMNNIASGHPNPHALINIAEDHAINYSIKDLVDTTRDKTLLSACDEFLHIGHYSAEYHRDKLSDIDILKLLLNQPPCTCSPINGDFDAVSMPGEPTTTRPTESLIHPTQEASDGTNASKIDTISDDIDKSISDLSESLQEILSTNTKGSAAGELFENLFSSIKVETGWFKKIKASFKRRVYYMTHDFTTSWSNLNSTYRHIYKSPKKYFIDDKIKIILSIDHSGSMSTEDLQKLLYLIESESKRISEITVLIHDTIVIKEFNIVNDFDISTSPEFTQALATRYTSGGTSHDCVFSHIQNMGITDTSQVIYLSFSDNYSDIDYVFKRYPIMSKLTNYWVCTVNNPVQVRGTNIQMI